MDDDARKWLYEYDVGVAAQDRYTSSGGTAIQIRWQSSDSAALGSLYVPSAVVASIVQGYPWSEATREAALSTSGSPARTAGTTQPDGVANGGLSPGHIAAIAVPVAIVVVVILLAAVLIFCRKRRQLLRAAAADQLPASSNTSEDGPAELAYDPEAGEKSGVELPAARFEPEPAQFPAGLVVDSSTTPSGTGSADAAAAQHTPELSGSLARPAPMELPGHQEPTHALAGSQTSPDGVVVELMSTPSRISQQPQSPSPAMETVQDLMARQAQLEQRRRTLLELQQIDEEQERIRKQLAAALHEQQSVQRAEMQ